MSAHTQKTIKSTIKKIDNFGNTIEETEGEFGTGA